ncbi:hypothetical protein [Rhizorhabdus sp.]|uniref:hypothetical protein n=2 Tax=Rhizorhabdus sp. TaxID=1968843 RepID=UPI001B48B7B7|nr:hypothetical protein [Rhizorhabdus sp.]
MSDGAMIEALCLTPTHDGEAALVITLRFANGGRSKVQIDADGMRRVMARAGVGNAADLIGRSWAVLDVEQPIFMTGMNREDSR